MLDQLLPNQLSKHLSPTSKFSKKKGRVGRENIENLNPNNQFPNFITTADPDS